LLTEQNYVDWLFKTSFISITHKLRTLSQFPSYVVDNQTYYQDYINEVKPYRTKIREYLIDYTGNDTFNGSLTDFDLPPYYAINPLTSEGIFRSPSGEYPYISSDEAKWQTFPWNQWYNNRTLHVGSIILADAGYGYSTPPTITITSTNTLGSGATAVAVMTGNVGNLSIASIKLTNTGSGYTTTPQVIINGSSTKSAIAYAKLIKLPFTNQTSLTNGNSYPLARTFDTAIKFDRISYNTSVTQWQPNTSYTAGTIITYAILNGNTMVRQAYTINSNITTGSTFIPDDYTLYAASNFKNANDRIMGYYQPSNIMPTVDTITVALTLANTAGNVITNVTTNTIYVFPQDNIINGMAISGDGVPLGYISNIAGNVGISIDGNPVTCTQITLTVNVALVADTTITATYNSLDQLLSGITYPSSPISGPAYSLSPLFGETFDNTSFDAVKYSVDGIPLLSDSEVDLILQSLYTDEALGTDPNTITTDGGAYVDAYHSHAPEELVPGITFDTLDMRVYTQIDNYFVGYRIFNNMLHQTSYLRISDASTTTLANALNLTDTIITVANAAVLPTPNINNNVPGVVFVGGERITYWTANVVTNTLGQIRRGTQGTGAAESYPAGTLITDGSVYQNIPGVVVGNVTLQSNLVVTNTTTGNTVTILANTTLATSNIWLNHGTYTAADGTGFAGATTIPVEYLKAGPATLNATNIINDNLVTEDAINTLIAENGTIISLE